MVKTCPSSTSNVPVTYMSGARVSYRGDHWTWSNIDNRSRPMPPPPSPNNVRWLIDKQDVVREVFSHLDRKEVGYVDREQVRDIIRQIKYSRRFS